MTNNLSILNHCVRLLPDRYIREFSYVREQQQKSATEPIAPENMANVLWTCLETFLTEEKQRITNFRPHMLDAEVKKNQNSAKVNAVKAGTKSNHNAGKSGGNAGKPDLSDQVKKRQAEYGNCPVCKKPHTWKSSSGVRASDRLADCPQFRGLTTDDRVAEVIKHKCCIKCLSWRHTRDQCTYNNMKCLYQISGNDCAGPHHRMLHGANSAQINLHQVSHAKTQSEVMLPIIQVDINGNADAVCLLDGGSSTSIITDRLANELDLPGEPARVWVELAGEAPRIRDTTWYYLDWRLPDGSMHKMKLLGLESITSNNGELDVGLAYSLFPDVPAGALDRPKGDVELLIGQDYTQFQPFGGGPEHNKEGLRVMQTLTGTGWVLTGRHKDIKNTAVHLTAAAAVWRDAVYLDMPVLPVNHISTAPVTTESCVHCCKVTVTDFFETEVMGVSTPRKCKRCQTCVLCNVSGDGRSLQDQRELDLMKDNIKLDTDRNKLVVSYPAVGDLSVLQDNRLQAEQRAAGLHKQLNRRGLKEVYDDHFKDYISRGVLEEVSLEQIEKYKDTGQPVHYVAHHAVYNSHSLSSSVRLVIDSSIRNQYTGPTLNQLIAKGPSSLNLIFNILIKWRSYSRALVFDISKLYHQFETGEKEFYLRLVVWKLDDDNVWRV